MRLRHKMTIYPQHGVNKSSQLANITKRPLLRFLVSLRNHFTGEFLDVRVLGGEIHVDQQTFNPAKTDA